MVLLIAMSVVSDSVVFSKWKKAIKIFKHYEKINSHPSSKIKFNYLKADKSGTVVNEKSEFGAIF